MSRILLITDAWEPQVNGVVTTLKNIKKQAEKNGDKIFVFSPQKCFIKFPIPFYDEIKIGFPNPIQAWKILKLTKWDHIHIATPEAPIGYIFSRYCKRWRLKFSTSLHSKYPEFIEIKFKIIKAKVGWRWMQYAFMHTKIILTTTPSMKEELISKGFKQKIFTWSRGVDREIFFPILKEKTEQKTLLCVSRISEEKNLDEFCKIKLPNTKKVLVGSGPYLDTLKQKYKDVEFVGKKKGLELSSYYQNSDVFVFPSKTDTFGVVNVEALSCGTPVAAFPVTGPKDIIENGIDGFLNNDLEYAINKCFELDRNEVYKSSLKWTWENCYKQFKEILIKP